MIVLSPDLIQNKKVLLRLDIDVFIENGKVVEDFRLKAALPTLKLCLEHASEVIAMGHIGRPEGQKVPGLSVEPIYDWFWGIGEIRGYLGNGKLKILENLRFEEGEDKCDPAYAGELAKLGDPDGIGAGVFVNEAFAAHHPAASTTVLPTLLPHAAGLNFFREVGVLRGVRESASRRTKRPLVAIIGGIKIEDKEPAVLALSKIADHVLVGGKIVEDLEGSGSCSGICRITPRDNILLATLNEEKTDITAETVESWGKIIKSAKMIVWSGPLGKVEEPKNFRTHEVANLIISSEAESIIGGGDTISYLGKLGLLEKFSFVSTGGGAMLEFLINRTLPTIEVLK